MTFEKDVYSSMVSKVGYNKETKELFIWWIRGKRSVYSGVPEELAVDVSNAPSVGQMINSEVKPFYSHRYA